MKNTRSEGLSWLILTAIVIPFSASGAVADSLNLQIPAQAELRLGDTVSLNGSIHAPAGFKGNISLSADVSKVDASVAITPNVITVPASAGATDLPFKIQFQTAAESHSFKGMPIQLTAQTDGNPAPLVQTLLLTVNPVYEIDLTGGPAPEGWSSPQAIVMPKHDGGVTIRFVNLDTKSTHTIHGEGAIPHQDTDTPMAAATADHAGGVYEITVPAGDPTSGSYRCHDHESEDMLRSISFNN